jgi:hypothetical protein
MFVAGVCGNEREGGNQRGVHAWDEAAQDPDGGRRHPGSPAMRHHSRRGLQERSQTDLTESKTADVLCSLDQVDRGVSGEQRDDVRPPGGRVEETSLDKVECV